MDKRDKAILELKLLRDKLKQTHKRVLLEAERENEAAKSFLKDGNKQRAKLALMRKKIQMSKYEQVETQILNLENTVMAIEDGALDLSVLKGIELGNKELAKLHKELSPEKAQAIVDEFEDLAHVQTEIDAILQQQPSNAQRENINLTVEAELDEILAAGSSTRSAREYPSVPTDLIPEKSGSKPVNREPAVPMKEAVQLQEV